MNIYDDPKTKMAFNWLTGAGVTGGRVEVMRNGIIVKTAPAICTQYQGYTGNKAVVTGLDPNTTYSFRVGKAGALSRWGTFTTAKANNKEPFSFIYVADTQTENNYNFLHTNSQAVFNKYPHVNFWLHCGDLADDDSNHQKNLDSVFSKQQDIFYRYPFVPVQGNHDTLGSNIVFKSRFNLNSPLFDSHGSTYTFIYGDAQFFAINSEQYTRSVYNQSYINDLHNWMRAEINAHSDITWRIVYFHKNIYSSNSVVQREVSTRGWFDAMTPILDTLNIDIALQGHSHIYEVIGPVRGTLTPNSKPDIVPGSVSNVQSVYVAPVDRLKNLTGKSGGTFNVRKGTLYFTNGTFGNRHSGFTPYHPSPVPESDRGKFADIENYNSFFTGRLGQAGNSTYSHVSVSTENIVIRTYEIINGNSLLFDEIKIVKCIDQVISNVTYVSNTTIKDCGVILNNVKVRNGAKLTIEADRTTLNSGFEVELGSEFEIK
jgi:predicted phosphodiesterase